MINALMLCAVSFGIFAQNVLKKQYNLKTKGGGAFVFSAFSVLVACLFFVVSGGFRFSFTAGVLPYAIGFAAAYGSAVVASFLAIRTGPLSLTSLITSYSLIIPTFWGLLFLNEKVSVFFWVGFGLLMISLFLIRARSGEKKFHPAWLVFITLAFVGNGMASAVQTSQQRAFDGAFKNELMIVALLMVAALLLPLSAIFEKKQFLPSVKKGWPLILICGLTNAAVNLLVMLLVARMRAALMFPIISAAGILLTWGASRFVYKEILTRRQNLAMVFGIISVVLMNL